MKKKKSNSHLTVDKQLEIIGRGHAGEAVTEEPHVRAVVFDARHAKRRAAVQLAHLATLPAA
jgi:hypothetical protein